MLYPNESPFIASVQPRIDTFEIEREVERIFVESVGREEVLEVYANQYPGRIGVTLFLKHGKNEDIIELGRKIEDSFARQGLNIGHGSFGPKNSFTNSASGEARLVAQNDENRPLWPPKHRFRGFLQLILKDRTSAKPQKCKGVFASWRAKMNHAEYWHPDFTGLGDERLPGRGKSVTLYSDCHDYSSIRQALDRILVHDTGLPDFRNASILIKPNLNNDLTGNSTDLRVLTALILALQEHGYTNVTIADGFNIGIYRKGIDVFGRLGVRALAQHSSVQLVDLNHAPSVEVELTTGSVRVADLCLRADFFISVPKIKTHAEAGMSAAVKNLMGCVVGTDTRLVHVNLPTNLVRLNEVIKPDLILVDGLIGMEGNGPGDGRPKRLDHLLAGTDPFILDLLIARLVGLDRDNISYLTIARQKGYISDEDIARTDEIKPIDHFEPPPPRGLVTRLLDNRLLVGVRDLTRPIHGSETARRLLYRLGIMQGVYERAEVCIKRVTLNRYACDKCGRCLAVCPTDMPITDPDFDFWGFS